MSSISRFATTALLLTAAGCNKGNALPAATVLTTSEVNMRADSVYETGHETVITGGVYFVKPGYGGAPYYREPRLTLRLAFQRGAGDFSLSTNSYNAEFWPGDRYLRWTDPCARELCATHIDNVGTNNPAAAKLMPQRRGESDNIPVPVYATVGPSLLPDTGPVFN